MKKTTVLIAILFIMFLFVSKQSIAQTNTDSNKSAAKVCTVTGETIEEGMGQQLTYLGKTYDFCCKHCVAKFKKEPMDYVKNMTCPVSGEAASKDKFVELEGMKYYFCCEHCMKKFQDSPDKFLKK